MKSLRMIVMGAGVLGIALFALTGCEEKTSSTTSSTAPKPDDDKTMLDPSLGRAIAASSASAVKGPRTAPTAEDGPPPSGVFTLERAEQTHAKGKPLHIEMGTTGAEPRILLTPTTDAVPKTLGFTVATMMGQRRSLPTVDMTFGLKVEKPKKKAGDAGVDLLPMPVTSKLTKVVLSAEQPGQIPPEVAQEVAKMNGSQVNWSFVPTGGISTVSIERSEKARPELEHNLVAVVETLASAALPAPKEAVGVGAAWVARSRDIYGGLDLISYRMIRVIKIDGDRITYAVESRQYASSPDMVKPGLPEGGKLVQFECTASGEFEIVRGQRLAEKGKITHTMKIGLQPPGAQPNQMMPLVLQSTVAYPIGG